MQKENFIKAKTTQEVIDNNNMIIRKVMNTQMDLNIQDHLIIIALIINLIKVKEITMEQIIRGKGDLNIIMKKGRITEMKKEEGLNNHSRIIIKKSKQLIRKKNKNMDKSNSISKYKMVNSGAIHIIND